MSKHDRDHLPGHRLGVAHMSGTAQVQTDTEPDREKVLGVLSKMSQKELLHSLVLEATNAQKVPQFKSTCQLIVEVLNMHVSIESCIHTAECIRDCLLSKANVTIILAVDLLDRLVRMAPTMFVEQVSSKRLSSVLVQLALKSHFAHSQKRPGKTSAVHIHDRLSELLYSWSVAFHHASITNEMLRGFELSINDLVAAGVEIPVEIKKKYRLVDNVRQKFACLRRVRDQASDANGSTSPIMLSSTSASHRRDSFQRNSTRRSSRNLPSKQSASKLTSRSGGRQQRIKTSSRELYVSDHVEQKTHPFAEGKHASYGDTIENNLEYEPSIGTQEKDEEEDMDTIACMSACSNVVTADEVELLHKSTSYMHFTGMKHGNGVYTPRVSDLASTVVGKLMRVVESTALSPVSTLQTQAPTPPIVGFTTPTQRRRTLVKTVGGSAPSATRVLSRSQGSGKLECPSPSDLRVEVTPRVIDMSSAGHSGDPLQRKRNLYLCNQGCHDVSIFIIFHCTDCGACSFYTFSVCCVLKFIVSLFPVFSLYLF